MMRRTQDDRGAALIAVVVLGFVMMILVATGLTVAGSGLQQAVGVQRSTSALDAAFAGVQDYLARVNVDQSYIKYGNRSSSFSAASAVTPPDPWNDAFGLGASTGNATMDETQHRTWAYVPGSDKTARFRYEVDTTTYASNGIVRLRVTGLAGQRTRTLLANLRVKGFVDYVYFTDYELQDPAISGSPGSCTKYKWQGRANGCSQYESRFAKNDAIYGDLHSNDTVIICGTTLTGTVETANTGTPLYTTPSGCTNSGINAKRVDTLPMPSTNTGMLQDAACVYTGPTQITYHADANGANPTMTVVSPWSKNTRGSAALCGAPAALHSAAGATVPQLDKDLLYVQDVVATPSTDPNYWSTTDKPANLSCIGTDNTSSSSANGIGWSLTTGGTTIRYPSTLEAPSDGWQASNPLYWDTSTPAYGCRSGDLYVSGRVSTLTTAASSNYVYVTDDITYANKATDILGLVGAHAVLVYNPMRVSTDVPLLTDFNREIDAAILSVDNTFQVQNYYHGGTRGQLTIFGSIAQRFRGPVGSVNPDPPYEQLTGYTKYYQYDPLLKTLSPPKFLAPSSTTFAVTQYAAVPSAFTPAGVSR